MAELNLFECKRCGWTCEAPVDGFDFLMFGAMTTYMCSGCKKIITISEEQDPSFLYQTKCPECNGKIYRWSPDYCPECGGDLEDKGVAVLMD